MLTIIVLAMLIPILAPAQDKGIKLFGYVFDSDTKTPIPGATVLVDQNQAGMSTNEEGYFSFSNIKTPALLYVSCVGYESKQLLVQSADSLPVKVHLKAEIRKIGEVTITGEKISKLVRGDTLNIVDYEISNDRIIMVANPYKHLDDQQLYLATITGDILNSEKISLAGAKIDIPESIDVLSTVYLFKDFNRNIQLLTRDSAYQIAVNQDTLKRLYPIDIYRFTSVLLPVKAILNGRLFSQKSTLYTNETFCIKKGEETYRHIKTVNDPYGSYRYVRPIAFAERNGVLSDPTKYISPNSYERFVGAPVVRRADDVLILDFFGNNIEFFNSDGVSVKTVPISFHLKDYTELLVLKRRDIDQNNFTQQILYDEKANRIWSLWSPHYSGHYTLKEIDPDTGTIITTIEIPDYPYVKKIRVYNNQVYFLYTEKKPPYNRSLFRMGI